MWWVWLTQCYSCHPSLTWNKPSCLVMTWKCLKPNYIQHLKNIYHVKNGYKHLQSPSSDAQVHNGYVSVWSLHSTPTSQRLDRSAQCIHAHVKWLSLTCFSQVSSKDCLWKNTPKSRSTLWSKRGFAEIRLPRHSNIFISDLAGKKTSLVSYSNETSMAGWTGTWGMQAMLFSSVIQKLA